MVNRFLKALYDLLQAPHTWYSKINRCLEQLGSSRCPYEHTVYTRKVNNEIMIVGVHVDDLLFTGTSVTLYRRDQGRNECSIRYEQSWEANILSKDRS